jgi:hypothetical protein
MTGENMSTQSRFFADLGLPYQAENVHQMFALMNAPEGTEAVVAQVAPGRYYVGYHNDAENVEKKVKTVKKYRVTSVTRIKKG